MRKPCQSPGQMKNSSYYIAPVGDCTHDLPHTVASNMVKVSHALNHSATEAVKDVLQAEIGREPPLVMLFADDLVICEHSRAEVKLQLERSHGLRVTRRKTEYMPCQ